MEKCRVSDDWAYKGMKVVFMENQFLKIGILADRGSDIFEFNYKPANLDPLLRLEKGIQNPNQTFSQIRDTTNQFEDYYYGGWQEILPNSPAFRYKGAEFGQHGEVSLIPWKYAILNDSEDEVSVKFWTEPLRMPLKISKTLTLKRSEAKLFISETLVNNGAEDVDIMWGHHIAFGLPFLKSGAKVKTNATKMTAEEQMPEKRLLKPNQEFDFPNGIGKNGEKVDVSKIAESQDNPYSELIYLSEFTEERAFYSICNEQSKIGFRVEWAANVFKNLWFWQERYGMKQFPWWGKAYAVALEPWTSKWTAKPLEGIENEEWLKIEAGKSLNTTLTAEITAENGYE